MIGLAVAGKAEDSKRIVERLVRSQEYRLIRPFKFIEVETGVGYVSIAAREDEIIKRGDVLAACIYHPRAGVKALEHILESEDLVTTLMRLDLFFSGAIIEHERIVLFRDHVGHMPLAYAWDGGSFMAALSKSALGSAARSLEPGHMLVLDHSGSRLVRWYHPTRFLMNNPEEELAERLIHVAEKYLSDTVFLGFSGGLDSSILAHIAALAGRNVRGITVAMKGSLDYTWAQETAGILGIELEILEPCDEELVNAVRLLSSQLTGRRLMDLSIASIMLLAARRAGGVLVVGQGADELFGGYWRYERILLEHGIKKAAEMMSRDVERIGERNLERDELAAALAGSQLLAPYVARPIYEAALSIDPELKLRILDGRVVRKWILRRAAEILGVPGRVLERPKKAAQYSSGIQRRLGKLLMEKKL
jgi:asparagine synthase (glutamine-hydrolysing)